jgi:phosphatidate cytidylyltransferase
LSPAAVFARNLAWRVATAAVALPAILAVIFWGPPVAAVALIAAACLLGLRESFGLLQARGLHPEEASGLALAAALFLDLAGLGPQGVLLWPVALVVALAWVVRPGAEPAQRVADLAATLLVSAYLGGLGGMMAGLRLIAPVGAGPWRLGMLLAVVMAADTVAFFVGNAVGRHRLAPALSPGKTVEGGIGGLAGGVLAAWAVRALALPSVPVVHAILLGLLVAAFAAAGDLFESLLKRWAGVKDSGALLPGHGGMLDRLDSLLFGAPVLYYYFVCTVR